MRAVLIAGDHRTFNEGIDSAHEILRGADVYVSMWDESRFVHQCHPNKTYIKKGITDISVRTSLRGHRVIDILLEKHDAEKWLETGYNSNFIHRIRAGIDLIKRHGKKYESVVVMRPDFFFGDTSALVSATSVIPLGEFKTIWMAPDRFLNRNLNDTLFAVHGDDLDRSFPTVEEYQPHKEKDWHSFLFEYVVDAGFNITGIDGVHCAILRPPAFKGMTFEDALANTARWDNDYIYHVIRQFGMASAIRNWSKDNVVRALRMAGCGESTINILLGET